MDNREMIRVAVGAMADKKAVNVKVLHLEKLSDVADYFILCNGTSVTQIKAIADEVEVKLKEAGAELSHREGYSSGSWILLDYTSVIIHVFHPTARDYYNLEKLWADAEELDLTEYLQ